MHPEPDRPPAALVRFASSRHLPEWVFGRPPDQQVGCADRTLQIQTGERPLPRKKGNDDGTSLPWMKGPRRMQVSGRVSPKLALRGAFPSSPCRPEHQVRYLSYNDQRYFGCSDQIYLGYSDQSLQWTFCAFSGDKTRKARH